MNQSLSLRALAVVCLLFGATAGLASANLVTNGGFETGDFTGWIHAGNTTSDTVAPGLPHSGTYSAALGPVGSTGSLQQNFATVAGAFYDLNFFLLNLGANGAGAMGTNVFGDSTDFRIAWNGVEIFDASNVGSSYTPFNFLVQATGAATALEFVYRNDASSFVLDDVSLELHSTTATAPETSSTALLMGVALVGLFGVRRFLLTART